MASHQCIRKRGAIVAALIESPVRCHSLYNRKNHSRFHDDLDHDRSDHQSGFVCKLNCRHASQRTSKDRLASISLRRNRPGRCGHNWPSSTRSHHGQIQMRRTGPWTYFKVSSARVCTRPELHPARSCICPCWWCRKKANLPCGKRLLLC